MSTTQMPWIKLYTELLDDPKVSELKLSEQMVFVKLLLFAGECDCEGLIGDAEGGYSMSKIAWRLRIPAADLRHAAAKMLSLGLVEEQDGGLLVPAFTARQGRPQAERQQMWRERQQRKRHPAEAVTEVSPVTPRPREEESREEKRREVAAPRRLPPRPPAEYPSSQIFRDTVHRWPVKSLQAEMHAVVGSEPEDVELWRKVVRAWIGLGWNPMNTDGMLDCFKRKEIPKSGRPGDDGKPSKMTDKEYGERLRAGTLPVEPEPFIPPSMRA